MKLVQSGNEILPVYVILQKKRFHQKSYKKLGLETSFMSFLYLKNPLLRGICESLRRLTYPDSFTNTCPI